MVRARPVPRTGVPGLRLSSRSRGPVAVCPNRALASGSSRTSGAGKT